MSTNDARGLIYLASPYSHDDPGVMQQRFEQVCSAAAEMMSSGMFIFSPIAHTHPIAQAGNLPTGFDFWEAYDTAMISRCSELCVLALDGWEQSEGVLAEIEIAKALGVTVTYRDPQ